MKSISCSGIPEEEIPFMPSDNTPSLSLYPPGWPIEWQQCLNAFIRHLAEQPGASPKSPREARRVLLSFFSDSRLPGDYSAQDITSFVISARNFQSRHKVLNEDLQQQWRSIVSAFYDFAATCTVLRDGTQVPLLQGPLPTRGIVPPSTKPVGQVRLPGEQAIWYGEPPLDEPPRPYQKRESYQQAKSQERTQPRQQRQAKPQASMALTVVETDDVWKRCMLDYLRSVYERGRSTKSATLHAGQLRLFFSGSAGGGPPKHPSEYTRVDVEDFVHRAPMGGRNAGGEPSIGTKITRLHILRSFYKYTENYTIEGPDGKPQRLLQTLPPTLGIPQVKRGEPRPKAMSFDEIRRFFAAIDASDAGPALRARDRCIFMWYLITLRRRESILRLTWGDIARVTITDKDGPREIWQYSFVEKGRAGAVETLELPESCAQALLDYLRVSNRLETIKPEHYLFVPIGHGHNGATTYADSHKPLWGSTIVYSFRRWATRAGLDTEKLSVHSFRHSGIQQRLLAGEDMFDVMKISGHRSLDIFYRYARRLTGVTDPGASKIEKRFSFLEVK